MKKRILVIGSKGMAGHIIYHHLKDLGKYHVRDISRSNDFFPSNYCLDVTDFSQLIHIIQNEKPDVVINCIGILNQDAENNPDKAILINSYLPQLLAQKGLQLGYKLIHLSTDCVFSGKKGNYKKKDTPDGSGFYAKSKALGEINYGEHLTLRTSIVGPELKREGIGLFNWFMQQHGKINGYTNAIWTGITTIELANCIERIIEKDVTGVQHLVNNQSISKFDLILLFKNLFQKNTIQIEPYHDYIVDKSLVNEETALVIKTYSEMLLDMKNWMDEHKHMYADYYFN